MRNNTNKFAIFLILQTKVSFYLASYLQMFKLCILEQTSTKLINDSYNSH